MCIDEQYMRRCIQLARNGMQNAQPNPMVGAVIVHKGRIIGEGYHVRCGEGHAEVNACASVRPEDECLLPESTIYVSLAATGEKRHLALSCWFERASNAVSWAASIPLPRFRAEVSIGFVKLVLK